MCVCLPCTSVWHGVVCVFTVHMYVSIVWRVFNVHVSVGLSVACVFTVHVCGHERSMCMACVFTGHVCVGIVWHVCLLCTCVGVIVACVFTVHMCVGVIVACVFTVHVCGHECDMYIYRACVCWAGVPVPVLAGPLGPAQVLDLLLGGTLVSTCRSRRQGCGLSLRTAQRPLRPLSWGRMWGWPLLPGQLRGKSVWPRTPAGTAPQGPAPAPLPHQAAGT